MEEILARAKQVADEAEVFMVSSEETPVEFEANRLKHIQSKQSSIVALRIVKDGRIGYATSTSPDDIDDLVANAVATAEFGSLARFTFPSFSEFPEVDIFDPACAAVTLDQMTQLGQQIVDAVTGHTAGIVCEAGVSKTIAEVGLINSRGGQVSYRQSGFSLALEGQLTHGTDMLFVFEGQSSCRPILDAEVVTSTVIRQLEMAREHATVRTGTMPVVFTPMGVVSTLARPIISAFNGKNVLEGASPIGNRVGECVFDAKLTLSDNPTVPFRPGSGPCDDEGVPTKAKQLIDHGKVCGFIYDLQTAGLANTETTGNARRSQGGPPGPAPGLLFVEPGETSFDDMIADIKEGLVVEQVMGATQGNVLGGDFSGNVLLGFKVENGRIVGRVKDTMVSGNAFEICSNLAAVGNDARWAGGLFNIPSLCCARVSVTSK